MSRYKSGIVLFVWFACAHLVLAHTKSWLPAFKYAASRCTIERVPLKAITQADFNSFFLEQSPVILEGTKQDRISASTEKHVLLQEYGSTSVKLSSANTFSHGATHSKLREYIDSFSSNAKDAPKARANESFYLFGPHAALSPRLSELVEQYSPPPFAGSDLAFSFGIGAHATGIPFHVHGHGFSEVIHGSKRWLLYPPDHRPPFDPDAPPVDWLENVYPSLTGSDKSLLEECNIGPGEVLYFPSNWWHAVVNVGETVFVSSFEKTSPGHAGSAGFW